MKYQLTESFRSDYTRLTDDERALFRDAVRRLNAAYDQRSEQPLPQWPASLRVKRVQGATGVWEMTWSFAGPDGRASFEFVTIDGELALRWRRIGSHRIFSQP